MHKGAKKVKSKKAKAKRKGSALLIVLFIVMAITILSLGFLSRSDVELACGENMILRTQMDYLAESGLEHARGLILNNNDFLGNWTAYGQRLYNGDDYYDVKVVQFSDCNYKITCDAYREKGGEKTGRSSLEAELRLNPCIAFWTQTGTTIPNNVKINGDVYCNGTLTNNGTINGDVFSNILNGSGSKSGQKKMAADLSLKWPRVTAADFTSKYPTVVIGASLCGQMFGPYEPVRVCHCNGNLELAGDVIIDGMLVVNGDLRIRGNGNIITAAKNLPAMLVIGNLIIENGGKLDVYGLAVVDGEIQINAGATNVSIHGGLFVDDGIVETAADSSGNGRFGVLCNGPIWRPGDGKIGGAMKFDGADDYIEVRDESSFDITSRITVSAWIKVNAFTKSYQAIVTKGNNAWRIQRWSNTNYIEFACTGLSHNPYGSVLGDISVNDGQWHHVAGVYDGSRIYLYVDGILNASTASSGTINTNNFKVLLGENAQERNRYWNGLIDDVRVYNRDLSAAEIGTIKAGGAVSGLVGHWKLDENGGNVSITAAPSKTAIITWSEAGAAERWGQAGGAFFRSIKRK